MQMLKHAGELSIAPQAFIAFFAADTAHVNTSSAPVNEVAPAAPQDRNTCRLKQVLAILDADMSRPDWFRVAAAVFNTARTSEEGYALFDDWSSGGAKYKGPRDTRAVWKSFRPGHSSPITIGTLRYMAELAGHDWTDICERAENAFQSAQREGT
jgi:hypothetical protein